LYQISIILSNRKEVRNEKKRNETKTKSNEICKVRKRNPTKWNEICKVRKRNPTERNEICKTRKYYFFRHCTKSTLIVWYFVSNKHYFIEQKRGKKKYVICLAYLDFLISTFLSNSHSKLPTIWTIFLNSQLHLTIPFCLFNSLILQYLISFHIFSVFKLSQLLNQLSDHTEIRTWFVFYDTKAYEVNRFLFKTVIRTEI
jgi:hypothetical protein